MNFQLLTFNPAPFGHGMSLSFHFQLNYKDHLGNNRISYTFDPEPHQINILEENHYYPFGLKHGAYNQTRKDVKYQKLALSKKEVKQVMPEAVKFKYLYNSKELQDELGLNIYDYGARTYDPAVPRFWQIDPLAEKYSFQSVYVYADDNPVFFVDINGMGVETDYFNLKGKKVKHVEDGKNNKKMVLTYSKKAKKVDEAISKGYVVTAFSDSEINKMEEIYNFAENDKTSTEKGFVRGTKGESIIVTGKKSGEITKEWNTAYKDLYKKGSKRISDVHLHPFVYNEDGELVSYGSADASTTDKENMIGSEPSVILGFKEQIYTERNNLTSVDEQKIKYVRTVGFYNAQGNIIHVSYSTLRKASKKINRQ